jgi:hypothetical protein
MPKDVTIRPPPARAFASVEGMQHHCPLCKQTFGWEKFRAHALDCIAAHREEER